MSSKKRCVIQKLDFENCIVTSIKTTARGRKKLRARITREIERFSDVPEETQQCELLNSSPKLNSRTRSHPVNEPKSPVLMKKPSSNRGSPVFFKRKTPDFLEEGFNKFSEDSAVDETSPPRSPVFKTLKKHKITNVTLNTDRECQNVSGRIPSLYIFNNRDNSNSPQIDVFTLESKESVDISSVNSEDVKNASSSFRSNEIISIKTCPYGAAELENSFSVHKKSESPKPNKRNYKKNSLLGRLHKLQQKQASEKLLWHHQNRKYTSGSLKIYVISFWKEEFNYFLKCQSDLESTFLIVDSRWVPRVKNVKEGSVLLLNPPWKKVIIEEPMMSVLLNVIFLDVLEETVEPVVQKQIFETVSPKQFEADEKLFIASLFSSWASEFLN